MAIYDTIIDLFEYRDNDLWWKERPARSVDISKPAGTIHHTGYRQIGIKGKYYRAHRLIYLMHNPSWDITDSSQDNSIDHKDEDKLNNSIGNLRVATHSQNQANSGKYKNNTSGHRGVYWHKRDKKWHVTVTINKKSHFGGYFVNKEEAIAKAIQMRNELHGDFANHG